MSETHPDRPPSSLGLVHGGFDDERFARYLEAINHPGMEPVTRPANLELQEKGIHLTRTRLQMYPGQLLDHSVVAPFWELADIGPLLTSMRPMADGGMSEIGVYRSLEQPHFDEREAKIAHILLSEVVVPPL